MIPQWQAIAFVLIVMAALTAAALSVILRSRQ